MGVTHDGMRVATVVNVTNDDTRVGFGDADVGQQRLAVLNPNTGDHGP